MDIVCDMGSAPDTGPERMREYHRLFAHHLVGRERTAEGIRFRFRAGEAAAGSAASAAGDRPAASDRAGGFDSVEAWVRDLAAREKACCAFFDFTISTDGDEVRWDATVIDDDVARAVLEEFYHLPENAADGDEELERRLRERGLQFVQR